MAEMVVAFYTGRARFYNRAVSWILYGPHSHAELILDEDDKEVGLLKCGGSSLMDSGVRIKWMKLNPAHWQFVTVDADYVKADKWFRDHRGEDHDLFGLLGCIWRRLIGKETKWSSGAAIAAALGFPDPWRFDPMSLWAALVAQANEDTRKKSNQSLFRTDNHG